MTVHRTATSADAAARLVDRYVHAVARHLPAAQRADVADELRAGIWDSVDDRTGETADDVRRELAVREVLTEMGEPTQLSHAYAAGPRHLIGPRYFDDWWTTLRALVVTVVPIIVVVVLAVNVGFDRVAAGAAIGDAVWTGFTAAIHIAFWVTGVFWVLERTGSPSALEESRKDWSPDDLPELPRSRQIGVPELVWGAGVTGLALAWLPWQHFRSPLDGPDGVRAPMLDPELWSNGWAWGFVALLVVTLVVEVVKFVVGNWTRVVTVTSIVLDVVFAAFLVALIRTQDVVNPAVLAGLDDPGTPRRAVDGIVVAVAVVTAVLGIVDAVRKHVQYRTSRTRGERTRASG
ncbi:hypothetical protein [Nocardioides massiliensis]|uniref:Uncharacterized protein n=1 Tax=Nocardioides massiliensis TaxID=1325935 RepID=A0ABT9NSJ1_9ACTN|nr:hypothetical protein [Nocardioides massiliensis]MDP9823368.1 hypothetical protein [Nocardioides massiliensis]